MEISPHLELALRERDRTAYSLRRILKPFNLNVAYANPGPACVELHLRSPHPPEFPQAVINFLVAHLFRVRPTHDGFTAHRVSSENELQVNLTVLFVTNVEDGHPFLRIEGVPHVA